MERGNRRLQYLIATAVSSSAVTVGVSFSWSTPVITKFYNNETNFKITEAEISWIAAVSSLGFMIGSLIARFTSDKFGRRFTILSSALPVIIGTILLIFAWKAWAICLARILWGVGTGMLGTVTMVYLTEIADKEIRGGISVANRSMLSFGCLLIMIIGPFLSYQTINYILLALPIWYFISCWWIPESPFFLVKEGKVETARKTLLKLSNVDDDVLNERLSQMRSQVKKEMSRSGTAKELFTGKQYRKAVIISFGLKTAQIMSGIHTLQNYIGLITQESNSDLSVAVALMIFGAVRFALGIMSSVLVDRLGRRPLIIYSFIGTTIMHAIVGTYFLIQGYSGKIPSPFNFIPFVGIIISVLISVLGFESVVYFVPAELFPLNVKSVAMTSLNIFAGFLNFLAVKSYQQFKDMVGLCGVFWLFGLATLFGGVFAYFLLPETKGKSLKEIQIELQGNIYDEGNEKLNGVASNENEVEVDGNKLAELKILNENKNGT